MAKARKRNSKNYASGNCKPKRRKASKARKTTKARRRSSKTSKSGSRVFKAKGHGYCAVKNGKMKGCDLSKAEAHKIAGV